MTISRRLVLLAGPSGAGKSRLAALSGASVVHLDDFYHDEAVPGLPRTLGIVDWDDIATCRVEDAVAALSELLETGHADVPVYDITRSRCIGEQHVVCPRDGIVIAEGVFAPDLLSACRTAGLAPYGIWLDRPRALTFALRLRRDFAEHRKPPLILVRRGLQLARRERAIRAHALALGCHPLSMRAAAAVLAELRRPTTDLRDWKAIPDE